MVGKVVRAVACTALAVGLLATTPTGQAGARTTTAPPPYFTDTTGAKVAVRGQYTPLVGRFSRLDLDDIIWYSGAYGPGSPDLTESRWSPCPGCAHGPFTKTTLPVQVHRYYRATVGDFAGDEHDDIVWISPTGTSYLWTNDGAGSFTSTPLSTKGIGDSFEPAVLRDSRLGAGKDDLLWDRADHAPWNSLLWIFPDDGSGVPVRQEIDERNGLLVGDFDGNGATDLLDRPWPAWCDQCYEADCAWYPGGRSRISYGRRADGQATTFTHATQTLHGPYWPIVGRFEGVGDTTDDILWVGGWAVVNRGQTYPPVAWHDSTDGIWLGRSSGHFLKSGASVRAMDETMLLRRDDGDTVLFPRLGKVWCLHCPVQLRPANVIAPGSAVVGRFTTADREDVFVYWPGTRGEHLLHPAA